jgi:hypothetical protein
MMVLGGDDGAPFVESFAPGMCDAQAEALLEAEAGYAHA